MFNPEDQKTILRFVFSQEVNLELALGINAISKEIAKQIIGQFLTLFENELRSRAGQLGPSWKVVNKLSKNPFQRYELIYLTKDEWHGLYLIAMSPENYEAKNFILGVRNNWDELGQRYDQGRIGQALDGMIRKGMISDWWPFYILAPDPYGKDWMDPSTLYYFIGERGKQTATKLSEGMYEIAQHTEKIIDELAQEWDKQHQKISRQ